MSDELLKFGDYVFIEMERHNIANEHYLHKVIRQSFSDVYVDVPARSQEEVIHDSAVPVVSCICCGVNETKVLKFRVDDVTLSNPLRTSPQKLNPLSADAILKIINELEEDDYLNEWEKIAIKQGIRLAEKAHEIGC